MIFDESWMFESVTKMLQVSLKYTNSLYRTAYSGVLFVKCGQGDASVLCYGCLQCNCV